MFEVLVIGHCLGDFYFQSDKLAEEKKTKLNKLVIHCLIYFVTVYVISMPFVERDRWLQTGGALLIAGFLHGIIDWIKAKLENCVERAEKHSYIYFAADQVLHLIVLYAVLRIGNIEFKANPVLLSIVDIQTTKLFITSILAFLICWKPASMFIYTVFKAIPNTVSDADAAKGTSESARIGAWIGILEREIILILGCLNQFSAIGFVLAAKSLARYKQLENKAFAEKYLVGTLMSAAISLLCIVGYKLRY